MKIFFLLLLLCFSIGTVFACTTRVTQNSKCNSRTNVSASLCNQYYECVGTWFFFHYDWFWELKTCPNGQVFSSTEGQCIMGSCTPTVKENSKCSSQETPIAISCYEYYKCVSISFWFYTEWLWKLDSCSEGEIFKSSSGKCEYGSCSIVQIKRNLKCDHTAKMPSLLCNQYYECMRSWYIPWSMWTWKIQICPDGEIYDAETEHCKLGFCSTVFSNVTTTDSTTSFLPIDDKGTTSTDSFTKLRMSTYSSTVKHKRYGSPTRTTSLEIDTSDLSSIIHTGLSQTTTYHTPTYTLIRRLITETISSSTENDYKTSSFFMTTETNTYSRSTTDSTTVPETTEQVEDSTTVVRADNNTPSTSNRVMSSITFLILLHILLKFLFISINHVINCTNL